MAVGKTIHSEMEQSPGGEIVTTYRGIGEGGPDSLAEEIAAAIESSGLPDLRRHQTLSPDYGAANPHRITAGGVVRVYAGGAAFEKYEIVVREAIDVYIGFDNDPTDDPGAYDDVMPSGQASRSERCEPANYLGLYFPVAPATDVEVVLYAGRMADPT